MDFTAWVESLKSLVQILAGFGFVTVFLAYLKHVSERRWWNGFKQRAEEWVNELVQAEERHPNELSKAEWRLECERLLSDANFGPLQIEQLLEISMAIAKGYANDKLFR